MAKNHQPQSSLYNADKPRNTDGAATTRILFDPKRRLLRNYCSAALLLCSSITTTSTALLFSMRGGDTLMPTSPSNNNNNYHHHQQYRLLHTAIIHRHGDRTPITPLTDEDYWKTTLPKPETLNEIANGTLIQRQDGIVKPVSNREQEVSSTSSIKKKKTRLQHTAKGRGPFGKLTQLGLSQMISVGSQLKEIFSNDGGDPSSVSLQPQDVRVISTDFPRTIQSVQAVLFGLFPDRNKDTNIIIDCRHTNWMIPDPQPRNRPEQYDLEKELIHRKHMIQKEQEMHPLAVKCTKALLPLLAKDAFDINMGIDNNDNGKGPETERVLPWAQLAEITKCLQVRDKLPKEITVEDQQALSDHLAWRWFQSLRDKRLAQLAMGKFASEVIRSIMMATDQGQQEHKLTIYSCHDSSLIGLICAFGLQNPSVWPEYGSFLKVDLLESTSSKNKKQKVVQFSLNGERLRWYNEQDEIPLAMLQEYINIAPH